MQVVFNPLFDEALWDILVYIGLESESASSRFEETLFAHLEHLAHFPYQYRKSIYYHNNDIRDCIFKGYTIPYLIDEKREVIVILDIFKWIEKKRKE